jgi:glycosyltransferase involved in cell wall biosynthesis
MPRLRILHVLFSSRIAGSERYCVDLANRQSALGYEVHVAGTRSSPLAGALDPEVGFHGFNWFFRSLLLQRLMNDLSPDICHGHLSIACKALSGAADRHHTVATLHVGYKPHQHARLDGLICVNRAQGTRLSGYRGLARTIPNWLPQAPADPAAPGIRAELGLDADVFLVGAVGRLHVSKGMDLLITAFRAAAPAHAALVILGEGPQRAQLERLRAGDPRIHILGYRPVVYSCLRDLDLFISPSREESFGLAILEAMSTGVPIIATAAEGPAEFLRDQPAVLVPLDSVDAMTAAIGAAQEKFRNGRLPRVGYDLSSFDPADRLANVTDFYAHVIGTKQRSRVGQGSPVAVAT